MSEDLIFFTIKIFFVNLYTYIVFFNIINDKEKTKIKIVTVMISCIISTILCVLFDSHVKHNTIIVLTYFIQVITLWIYETKNKKSILVSDLIASAIVYLGLIISSILVGFAKIVINNKNIIIDILVIFLIEYLLIRGLFKIKRFKYGFKFLQNNNYYMDIISINVSAIVIFAYSMFGSNYGDSITDIVIMFIILGIIMLVMIYKTLTLYYKQKLLEQNLKSYEKEIIEKDKQIQDMSDEKFKISKVNHEFYNRQRALEMAVKEFISNSNMEISKEIMIMDKIESLSKEYSGKIEEIKKVEKLPETEIEEIDEMFRYMQSECIKNDIEFSLKINGNIFYMINNLIETDRLVTLIGDHIRDAIIAVNHSANNYRSIVATLGMNDNCYEFRVYDTGIEFEIDTLLKLGIEPATTHAEEGGSGIGFITTFETMKNSKSSLIIEEKNKENDNDYTKAVIIKFDGKNEYRILSYRASEIKNKCKDNRIKIDNK